MLKSESRKPFREVGLISAGLGMSAWLVELFVADSEIGRYGTALVLLAAPCLLAQLWWDQRFGGSTTKP